MPRLLSSIAAAWLCWAPHHAFAAPPQSPATGGADQNPWWQSAVIYQIYPRSFQDTNGDGVGDLAGIIKRAPYLKALGVDAVWISPFYRSPMHDFGYDVTDYQAVDPLFGTMADADQLVRTFHQLGIKVLFDLVLNHTAIEHPWFQAARRSKTDPKRSWYVWQAAKAEGTKPNNWRSVFAGDAWTLDQASGEYYYHAFLPEQPDLNWRNPAVRQAMHQVMRFWLDKGVDGFRVDAIVELVEDSALRDEALNPTASPGAKDYDRFRHDHTHNQPETHQYLHELRQLVDSYPGDRVLVSEAYEPIPQLMLYYGTKTAPEAQLPFNFYLIEAPWQAKAIADYATAYDGALPVGAWPNWVLGNHDRSRLATRLGRDQERLAAVLLLTLRGTPTLYYGDELGMTDVPVPPSLVRDPAEKREPGKGTGRDPERTPMPWTPQPGAGFTTVKPWLPFGADYRERNVATEEASAASTLHLYQALLKLRRQQPALSTGSYTTLSAANQVFTYARRAGHSTVFVALNFSDQPRPLPAAFIGKGVLLSSDSGRQLPSRVLDASFKLGPHEGLVVR